ncbi:hypothetical protein CFD26_108790 [Aspergillus turcosus]|uniref:Uncharacterized protein n=1 Tax=Aspergillus turcosus TaxID=1245748 RepID=A0A3R7JKM2_9EURO|nr:hypothetical protein CFD26_108790 [Aspergillus turcosus]
MMHRARHPYPQHNYYHHERIDDNYREQRRSYINDNYHEQRRSSYIPHQHHNEDYQRNEYPAARNGQFYGGQDRYPDEGQHRSPQDRYNTPHYNPTAADTTYNKPHHLKPDKVMTFDPASTNVKFFIQHIRLVAMQEGVQATDTLSREFKKDPIRARREAQKLRFKFSTADTLSLPEYITQKISLLRAARTTDKESIKTDLWHGLDHRLASLVPPNPDKSLEHFKQRIRASKAGAQRIWDVNQLQYNKTRPGSKTERFDQLLSKLGHKVQPEDTDQKTPIKDTNKTSTSTNKTQKHSAGREPARPCHHCSRKHWDSDCTKKPKQVNMIKVDDLDDEDIRLLEELTSETISESEN